MFERSLRIRDFEAKDLETLHKIDRICFQEDRAFSRQDLLACLNQSGSIARIAEMQDAVVGFILARIEYGRHAHILTLDVVPGSRRQKIGSMLMEDLHRFLKQRKIAAAFLEVGTGNIAAQSLYEKLSYRTIETLPGYYYGEQDAYRMLRLI